MDKSREDKIKEYEEFLETTLKEDLKETHETLVGKYAEEKKWSDVVKLSKMLQLYKQQVDQDLKMYRSILKCKENEVYSLLEIKNVDRLYVKIGCNCLLEMDLVEAEKYANIRIKLVTKQIDHFHRLAVQIKVNIKLVLLAINELQKS